MQKLNRTKCADFAGQLSVVNLCASCPSAQVTVLAAYEKPLGSKNAKLADKNLAKLASASSPREVAVNDHAQTTSPGSSVKFYA